MLHLPPRVYRHSENLEIRANEDPGVLAASLIDIIRRLCPAKVTQRDESGLFSLFFS